MMVGSLREICCYRNCIWRNALSVKKLKIEMNSVLLLNAMQFKKRPLALFQRFITMGYLVMLKNVSSATWGRKMKKTFQDFFSGLPLKNDTWFSFLQTTREKSGKVTFDSFLRRRRHHRSNIADFFPVVKLITRTFLAGKFKPFFMTFLGAWINCVFYKLIRRYWPTGHQRPCFLVDVLDPSSSCCPPS